MKHLLKIYFTRFTVLLSAATAGLGCDAQPRTKSDVPSSIANPELFASYWYAGEAEITRYELQQMRYGEVRQGEAVLIYVTEDFLPERQVKNETGKANSTKVLKLNMLKKFETGIYDYSIMGSTFTPIDFRKHPYTLKATFSAQDWCGMVYSQLNLRNRKLEYQGYSYFEQEGDTAISEEATYFEEDIWTRMRLEPQMLPLGKIDMIPSQEFLNLNHLPFRTYKANAALYLQVGDQKSPDERYVYRLEFEELGRVVEWICGSTFPFPLISWEEKITSEKGKTETTSAKKTHTLKNSYWKLNGNVDSAKRDSLGLQFRWQE